MSEYWGLEVGPIRPPSEAHSLLIRVTRNCHWNRCTFCPVYKEKEFSRRPVEHVKMDIDQVSKYVKQLKEAESEEDIRSIANQVHVVGRFAFRSALLWFRNGMKSAFIQDADSLIIPPSEIVEILDHLREKFPEIERVTSYARSSTIAKIKDKDLKTIADAGLNRIHIGMESGSDQVLKIIRKGASKQIHISAGRKVKDVGMELSEYVMPGLGGRMFSEVHARESADALNQINPDFIRLRHLAVPEGMVLYDDFEQCNDVEVVREVRQFVDLLETKNTILLSDHILNLIPEVEGLLPDDKGRILGFIDHFLNLDVSEQTLYQLGRRMGIFHRLQDFDDIERRQRVLKVSDSQGITSENIDEITKQLMQRFI